MNEKIIFKHMHFFTKQYKNIGSGYREKKGFSEKRIDVFYRLIEGFWLTNLLVFLLLVSIRPGRPTDLLKI